MIASQYGMLGSVDSNTGDPLLGWDTDQFPSDAKKASLNVELNACISAASYQRQYVQIRKRKLKRLV
jgi:xylose isomerase